MPQPETTEEHDTFSEENTNEFRENTDKNLLTNDKYKDEVTLVNLNSLSKNTTQDNRLFDEQELIFKKYTWAYYSMIQYGYMCKICGVFFSDKPCPSGGGTGAWSHIAILLKENPKKRFS